MLSHNLDFEPSGPCNSKPLKKSSRLQVFFKIGSQNWSSFKIGQVLSVSGYDLEMEECHISKSIELQLKIWQ